MNRERFQLIFGRLEKYYDIYQDRKEITAEEYPNIMRDYCEALSQLVDDEDLPRILAELASKSCDKEAVSKAKETFEKIELFREFLVIERELLVKSGVDERFAEWVCSEIEKNRESLADSIADLNYAKDWFSDLQGIQRHICSVVNEMQDWNGSQQAKRTIKKWGMFTTGWALCIGNGAAGIPGLLVGDVVLSGGLIVASGASGRVLIKRSDEY